VRTFNCLSSERDQSSKNIFDHVTYLNGLFSEGTHIQELTITISSLSFDKKLSIFPVTILKDNNGNKRTGEINALEFFLNSVLNAYDFSNQGAEEIQTQHQTLINASVLGLILERLNNYKDAYFFTPSFITMYISRETIRRSVIHKFN
jgi:hypothetical protein